MAALDEVPQRARSGALSGTPGTQRRPAPQQGLADPADAVDVVDRSNTTASNLGLEIAGNEIGRRLRLDQSLLEIGDPQLPRQEIEANRCRRESQVRSPRSMEPSETLEQLAQKRRDYQGRLSAERHEIFE